MDENLKELIGTYTSSGPHIYYVLNRDSSDHIKRFKEDVEFVENSYLRPLCWCNKHRTNIACLDMFEVRYIHISDESKTRGYHITEENTITSIKDLFKDGKYIE